MAALRVTEFTDPGCPFAWSAEPARRRLDWLYGDHLSWKLCMVGLADSPAVYDDVGFTPERLSASFRKMAHEHHMPMDSVLRPRMSATIPACRATVAVRRHRPDSERAMLRAVRILYFSGRLLDEPETIDAAAVRTGIDPSDLAAWSAETETEQLLRADLERARQPTEQALALSHKLASTGDKGYRYTCPSLEIERPKDGARLSAPGFQPLAAYEVAVANLLPEAERRADPDDVEEVLAWFDEPLATAEVAAVCAIDLDEARERLGRVATEEHVGFDGLWHRNGAAA